MATHSSNLFRRIQWTEETWQVIGCQSQTQLNDFTLGFRGSSAGRESACIVGDPGLIPELGSSPGEAIGYPLSYSQASLVAQTVKNPPAMWETWV